MEHNIVDIYLQTWDYRPWVSIPGGGGGWGIYPPPPNILGGGMACIIIPPIFHGLMSYYTDKITVQTNYKQK